MKRKLLFIFILSSIFLSSSFSIENPEKGKGTLFFSFMAYLNKKFSAIKEGLYTNRVRIYIVNTDSGEKIFKETKDGYIGFYNIPQGQYRIRFWEINRSDQNWNATYSGDFEDNAINVNVVSDSITVLDTFEVTSTYDENDKDSRTESTFKFKEGTKEENIKYFLEKLDKRKKWANIPVISGL